MDYSDLSRELDLLVGSMLGPARACHSRNVAALAAKLCGRHGLDPDRGRAGGLAHDLCKELPHKEQRSLAAAFPGIKPGSSLMADKILHGPAAATLIARELGVDDMELLDAIAHHTVGKPDMSLLGIILYCADKLEPGRGGIDPEYRRRCLSLPPSAMLREVVAGLVVWLKARGFPVAPETLLLYNNLAVEASTTP